MIGNIFQEATINYLAVERMRLTIRMTGALYSILYEKLLRIGVVNYHEHDEGSIINYLQSDVTMFKTANFAVKNMICSCMNLVLSVALGVFFFK